MSSGLEEESDEEEESGERARRLFDLPDLELLLGLADAPLGLLRALEDCPSADAAALALETSSAAALASLLGSAWTGSTWTCGLSAPPCRWGRWPRM